MFVSKRRIRKKIIEIEGLILNCKDARELIPKQPDGVISNSIDSVLFTMYCNLIKEHEATIFVLSGFL